MNSPRAAQLPGSRIRKNLAGLTAALSLPAKFLRIRLLLLLACAPLFAAESPIKLPPGYRVETIEPPAGVLPEIEALDFAPDGTAYVSTRRGDLWRITGREGAREWHLFAHGLQEPLGLLVDAVKKSVFVAQRTEITELRDEDADGTADVYRTIGSGWGYAGNYSEYTHGLVRDSKGNFYFTLNLSDHGPGGVKGSVMTHNSPLRGWIIQLQPDGKIVPLASGLRSPAGIGISADDEVFVTENQGDWVPTGGLYHIKPGHFYGHPASLADWPEFKNRNLNDVPTEEFDRMRTVPHVYIPYGELANSPGEPAFDYTKGKFGPFQNQLFVGDQTRSNIFRLTLERVGDDYQGAAFDFAQGFPSGLIRGRFAPDGSYWVGEIDHGWPAAGGTVGALQRVVWDGRTVPFEFSNIRITPTGFRLEFTRPVDRAIAGKAASYDLAHWHFLYQPRYYSPKLDETELSATEASVSADGLSVDLTVPLIAGKLYRIRARVNGQDGSALTNNTGWYTVNRLLKK